MKYTVLTTLRLLVLLYSQLLSIVNCCVHYQLRGIQYHNPSSSSEVSTVPLRETLRMQSILRMSRSTTAVKPLCPSILGGRVSIANRTSTYQSTIKRYSQQSYGGDNNPKGNQPASRKSRELEHPGMSKHSHQSIPLIQFKMLI